MNVLFRRSNECTIFYGIYLLYFIKTTVDRLMYFKMNFEQKYFKTSVAVPSNKATVIEIYFLKHFLIFAGHLEYRAAMELTLGT